MEEAQRKITDYFGKQSQKRNKSVTTTTGGPPMMIMMCTARMRIGVDLTLTTVKVTTMNRNTTKGTQRVVTITVGTIQAVKVGLQTD
jgi:hypothetical protein